MEVTRIESTPPMSTAYIHSLWQDAGDLDAAEPGATSLPCPTDVNAFCQPHTSYSEGIQGKLEFSITVITFL